MDRRALWTLDQLVELVGRALAVGYQGSPNGRVRDLPDRRAVRWYTTIGLVDRPAAMRGRSALYITRHLLQIVAIKRRQAAGWSLAQIQQELVGASDATLRAVADLPEALLAGIGPDGAGPGPADVPRA
ncbi:MAG: MerR family transcriptional regulator, partial [Actinocatenispora sp.]